MVKALVIVIRWLAFVKRGVERVVGVYFWIWFSLNIVKYEVIKFIKIYINEVCVLYMILLGCDIVIRFGRFNGKNVLIFLYKKVCIYDYYIWCKL